MRLWMVWVLLVAALVVSMVVVGPYRYEQVERYGQHRLVRISRWSGEAEYLSDMGWLPLAYVPPQPR